MILRSINSDWFSAYSRSHETISQNESAHRPRDLPEAGDARQDHEPGHVLGPIASKLVEWNRARADETHLAAENVDELRQFVDAPPPQVPTDTGDARVAFEFDRRRVGRARRRRPIGDRSDVPFVNTGICVRDHRTKFVDPEDFDTPACLSVSPNPSRADAVLAEQNRSTRIKLHRHRGDDKQWREDYEKQDDDGEVSRALCDEVEGPGRGAETLGSMEVEKSALGGGARGRTRGAYSGELRHE